MERASSMGSNVSGGPGGGPMEVVSEDAEMTGADWGNALKILADLEQGMHHEHPEGCAQ